MLRRIVVVGIFLIFALITSAAQTLQFSGKPPTCTATPPAAAVALGYTKLVYCNALNSNSVIDVNNTENPWFLFYVTGFANTLSASHLANDGTALEVITIPDNLGEGLYSVTGNYGGGNTVTGGFYIEADMKFDDTVCASGSNAWPAIWMNEATATGPGILPTHEFTELDIFEYYLSCTPEQTAHDWPGSGSGTQNCQNSNNHITYTPGTGWNTYGGRLTTSIATGTGAFDWYINNTNTLTVTYSPGGKPNPAGSCANGAFATADTQSWTFALGGQTSNPVYFRNLHIWQAP